MKYLLAGVRFRYKQFHLASEPLIVVTNKARRNKNQKPDIRREAIAGVTTFFTLACIVVFGPAVLSTEGTGLSLGGVPTATIMVCFVMALLMGIYAQVPFAVAPGLGIKYSHLSTEGFHNRA